MQSISKFIATLFLAVCCIQFGTAAQEQQNKMSLGEVAESDFIDIRDDSWILREAFFAQEFNADIVDYGSLLSDDCAFETKDDEFEIRKKASYYSELRKNRTRIYRIMTTITGDNITYDFGRKGYTFPKGFSVWDNEFYGDEAGKFFFERSAYIPIAEDIAKAIRSELKSDADVKIAADVHVFTVNEWEERKQHSDLVKGWGILLGASASAVNRTWIVKHREVILKPIRFQFFVKNQKVYDVALLSDEDKSRIRSVSGSPQDFNAWSNVQGSELTVESYIEYHKFGITSQSDYENLVQLGISLKDIATVLKMGRSIDDLKVLKQNNLELSELADIQQTGGTLNELILLKKNSISIEDYKSIKAGRGTIADYIACNEAGCKDIAVYVRSISMQIPLDKYTYLCKQGVGLDDYQKLAGHNTTFEEYKTYSEVKPVTIDEFLTLKNDRISLDTYRNWAPHIEDVADYRRAVSYAYADFQAYNRIRPLTFPDYSVLKESLVPLRLYQDWSSTASSIQQYPLISTYKADHKEYQWFQTYDKSLDGYLSELQSGWRESKDFKEYKRDLHRQYLYPARKTSLVRFLTGGACVGAGFVLRAISSSYYDKSLSSYNSYRQTPNSGTWSDYKSNYDTHMYLLRAGDISFYAAGGFAILSGLTFFIKKDNPHYIAQIGSTNVQMAITPNINGINVTLSIEGGSR